MRIAAPHILNLLEFASYLGYDESLLKKHLSVPTADLSLFENNISDSELILIFKELIKKSGDNYFGLHYGCFLNIKAMEMIFTISKSATSLEQAIEILRKFMEATFPAFTFITSSKNEIFTIEVLCSLNDTVVNEHLCIATLCVMYRELRLITDDICNIKLQVPNKNIIEYEKMLGDVVQNGKSYLLLLDKKAIDGSLSKKSISRIALLLPSFLYLMDRADGTNTFSGQVKKMMLNMCEPELPDFIRMVSQFAMSSRSFQRKLKEEERSFRKISDEIKSELSSYLRKSKNVKTQDIAYLLGYSTPSAYIHAAKKWNREVKSI